MKANYHNGTQQEIRVEDNGSQKTYHLKSAGVRGKYAHVAIKHIESLKRLESPATSGFKNKDRKPLGK